MLSELYEISKQQQTEEVGTVFENISGSGILQLFVLRQVARDDLYVSGHQLVNQASQKLEALKQAGVVVISPEETVKFVLSLGEQAKNSEFWANFSAKNKELAACVKALLSKGYNQPAAGQSHVEAFVQSLLDREPHVEEGRKSKQSKSAQQFEEKVEHVPPELLPPTVFEKSLIALELAYRDTIYAHQRVCFAGFDYEQYQIQLHALTSATLDEFLDAEFGAEELLPYMEPQEKKKTAAVSNVQKGQLSAAQLTQTLVQQNQLTLIDQTIGNVAYLPQSVPNYQFGEVVLNPVLAELATSGPGKLR